MLRVEAEARKGGLMSFVNFSNHSSSKWGQAQLEAAAKYGEVIDIAFPMVPPIATKDDIQQLAEKSVEEILAVDPSTVMVQGESTLVYAVVQRLQSKGIPCCAACTRRRSEEELQQLSAAGLTREGMFAFMGFREY